MTDLKDALSRLRRPRLLIRAARYGLSEYDRKRDLKRIAGETHLRETAAMIRVLVAQEEEIERTRKAGDAAYSIARHIEVLVALMAECRLLPQELRT